MHKEIALHIDANHQRQTQICRKLHLLGFDLHRTPTISAAKKLVKKHYYRLALVHFDAVGKEIFSFCSFLRSGNSNAIVMALMTKPIIKIEEQLFDCGVNDVVTGKQISAPVLAKRIKAHLRNTCQTNLHTNTIRLKDTIIDFDRREVWCNGTIRQLPGILADLLKYFLDNPNRVISRKELQRSPIWADSVCSEPEQGGKTFDVNVSKLRRIIEPDPARPRLIESVRGVGWKLVRNGNVNK